jgi:hypothetical protein
MLDTRAGSNHCSIAQNWCVMRTIHTGIFQRTIRKTTEDWFRGGGGLLGSVNSVVAVAECARRARETFRKVFNLPEATPIVGLVGSNRPLTATQERDENRYVLELFRIIAACCDENSLLRLENLSRRYLLHNLVAEDVRALVFAAEVFYQTWEDREALVRKQKESQPVEFLPKLTLLNENLVSIAMCISELDVKIAVAPYEQVLSRYQKRLRRMRCKRKKKRNAVKVLWKAKLRRLDRKHPKWTNHAIAKEARKNTPKYLKRVALSTLQNWLKEIR